MRCIATMVAGVALVSACQQTPMRRLIEASDGTRLTEARLCGFAYGAPSRVQRGGEKAEPNLTLQSVAAEVLKKTEGADEETRRARAVSQLVLQHPENAVKELETALAANPADARLWSDLAAMRFELARHDDDARGFASALAAAANAVEANASLPEARFNYSLAANALHLETAAANALQEYLVLDSTSQWAVEARQRLSSLERQKPDWKATAVRIERTGVTAAEITNAVAMFPQQTRTWAEGEYLARWAEAYLARNEVDAEHWLALSRSIGEALRSKTGESLLLDAVGTIDRAAPRLRMMLANAHVKYRAGRIAYSRQNAGEALPSLRSAEGLFAVCGSPMALLAIYYEANALTDRNKTADAMMLLEPLLSAEPDYIALHAQVLWQRSVLLGRIGHLFEALEASRDSYERFERLGEADNFSRMLTNTANTFILLGRPDIAWQFDRRSLQAAARSVNDVTLEYALRAAAWHELISGHRETARALFDIELAMPVRSPRMRVDALVQRLKTRARADDLREARAVANTIPDPRLREEALDDINVVEACSGDPSRAAATLTKSIEFRTQNRLDLALPDVLLDRARVFRCLGRDREAIADLSAALSIIERRRAIIVSDDLKDTFLDTAREIVQTLFELYVSHQDDRAAFELVERTRARVLTDSLNGDDRLAPALVSADALAARISPRTVVAQYTCIPGGVAILVLRDKRLIGHVSYAPAIDDTVVALNKAIIADDRETTRSLSKALSDALLTPMSAELEGAESLIVIPDDTTASVPFAVLRDRITNRHLAEDVSIVMAPSASAYVHDHAQPTTSHSRAVLLGNPAFDTGRFPDLPALPAAGEEIAEISGFYRGATILTRSHATRQEFIRELETNEVIHLAAHAVVNERDPSNSLILLAPAEGDSGLLYLRDIATLKLRRRPVVVLAGCRTAFRAAGPGSIRSIALAFLRAGACAVVGSSWDIDDETTRMFSRDFHRLLTTGTHPARAVQNAQIIMIHSLDPRTRSPKAWAGFQIYSCQ